eukprot:CAMPEP_0181484648 /NCGR_PEP_ID=MMETSP1110-20121109/46114_1 /TAXON_ID=174948 /ORGANISM="Symbiodinium sp., Strain CCMP421" /LENGTH=218 /DNA_ID=CAMNT_0023610535 /DNA_START=352 /DNA_END=1009 /DNA_ORIENTATION=-
MPCQGRFVSHLHQKGLACGKGLSEQAIQVLSLIRLKEISPGELESQLLVKGGRADPPQIPDVLQVDIQLRNLHTTIHSTSRDDQGACQGCVIFLAILMKFQLPLLSLQGAKAVPKPPAFLVSPAVNQGSAIREEACRLKHLALVAAAAARFVGLEIPRQHISANGDQLSIRVQALLIAELGGARGQPAHDAPRRQLRGRRDALLQLRDQSVSVHRELR